MSFYASWERENNQVSSDNFSVEKEGNGKCQGLGYGRQGVSGGIILYREIRKSIAERYHGTIWISEKKKFFPGKGRCKFKCTKPIECLVQQFSNCGPWITSPRRFRRI